MGLAHALVVLVDHHVHDDPHDPRRGDPEVTVQHGVTAALAELASLHAAGSLTDDEFTAAKRMLLGGS